MKTTQTRKNLVAQQLDPTTQRNKTRDFVPGDRKPPSGGPYYTKITKNSVIA